MSAELDKGKWHIVDNVPLCVDLDGTLIRSDLLIESFFAMLKRNPLFLFLVPFWLLRGKAALKAEIANRCHLDVAVLPYHPEFLAWLREQHAAGRRLYLCTASHYSLAEAVADYLGVFDAVLASDGVVNLAGSHKRERLCAEFGEHGFDYAGNAGVDLQVWSHARNAIVVSAPAGLADEAAALASVEREFSSPRATWATYAKALRLHQWMKNILIFVPLLASHQFSEPQKVTAALGAFVAFGLCASSVYLLNDLLDLSADRRHHSKCRRPFASGMLPMLHGVLLIPALLGSSLLCALLLPWGFLGVLLVYCTLTLGYSLVLKRIVMLDVIVLAGLYTVRMLAGSAAISTVNSFWLLAFAMFLFLSLALVKRYAELREMLKRGHGSAGGRGYIVGDLAVLQSLGAAAGYLSVLVLALYINSGDSHLLYQHPQLIWLLCPLLLYWISRVWLKTERGQMHDDPVIFALRDRVSLGLFIAGAMIVWGAI